MSVLALTLKIDEKKQLEGRCFSTIDFHFYENGNSFILEVFSENKKDWNCIEFLLISTGKHFKTHFQFFSGQQIYEFFDNEQSIQEQKYILKRGIRILKSCDDLSNFPKDFWLLFKLFFGGLGLNPYIPIFGSKIPDYQLHANIDMIKELTNFEWKIRENPKLILYPKNLINSGDLLLIERMDGIDNLIHFGSGSKIGHSTVALWKNDQLFICESQVALYWPRKNIQCNEFEKWVEWANNADYSVVIIPLKKELQEKFDTENAWKKIDKLLETPYGLHNFIFGWIDTEDQNLPYFLDMEYFFILIRFVENFSDVFQTMFIDALNQRLKTNAKTTEEIWEVFYKLDKTISEVVSMPENDEWIYKDGYSLVCSSFVVKVLQAGGLFGQLKINATEFTPKDLVELNFWDNIRKVPAECEGYVENGFCQIMGKIHMDLGIDVNSVEPYDNMNEKCSTMAPDFKRTENCQIIFNKI